MAGGRCTLMLSISVLLSHQTTPLTPPSPLLPPSLLLPPPPLLPLPLLPRSLLPHPLPSLLPILYCSGFAKDFFPLFFSLCHSVPEIVCMWMKTGEKSVLQSRAKSCFCERADNSPHLTCTQTGTVVKGGMRERWTGSEMEK